MTTFIPKGLARAAEKVIQTMSESAMDEKTRVLPNGGKIVDRRSADERKATAFYVVGTDSFMSGWGEAPGTSYFAVACPSVADGSECVNDVHKRMLNRTDMKRVRICMRTWKPKLRKGDHLSIQWATRYRQGLP